MANTWPWAGGNTSIQLRSVTTMLPNHMLTYAQKESRLSITLDITNLKNSPMEYMYLAHEDFRPVNGSQLHYSTVASPQQVRVRSSIPSHVHPGPEYVSFLKELALIPKNTHGKFRPRF